MSTPYPERVILPLNARLYLGIGTEDAVKALAARDKDDVIRHASNAVRNLSTFIGEQVPAPKLTAREAEFSQCFHTYLRKYCDCPVTTLLYRLFADGQGASVWCAFVKAALSHEWDHREALSAANDQYRETQLPADLYMYCALQAWPQTDYARMIKTFREDGWFEWLPKRGLIKPEVASGKEEVSQ